MSTWTGPGSIIVHVYPDDVRTEAEKRRWRSLVRRRMKQGILPPTLDIQTPPQKVEVITNKFLEAPKTGMSFLAEPDEVPVESESKDEFEW